MSNMGQGPRPDAALGDLVSSLSHDVSELVQGQVELAKAELRESATAAAKASGLLIAAACVGFFAILFLLLTFGYALIAVGLPGWAAFLIVTVLLIAGAGILVIVGRGKATGLKAPKRSLAAAKAAGNAISRSQSG